MSSVQQHPITPRWCSGLLRRVGLGLLAVSAGTAPRPAFAQQRFAIPSVMRSFATEPHTVEVSLVAAPARRRLIPGKMTEVYAYNGQIPGPTLEVHEGDRVIVHFRNLLPEPTTVHWHGIHLPVEMDGSPMHPIPPGENHHFDFTIPPGTAGTYWYHPHPHHSTGFQVARGLYGAILVHPVRDPLPQTVPDRLLILSDNRFNPDGSIAEPTVIDGENGREGEVLFVNGQIHPTIPMRSGEVERWRVVNASAGRYYRLAIAGQSFLQIGTDAGLFERPVERSEILLAPSERVELLVRGSGAPGSRTVLQDLPYDRYLPQTRPPGWDQPRDLLTLQYSHMKPIAPPAIPTSLRPVPPMDPAQATATRLILLGQGFINGKKFDMHRVDITAQLGATEIWQVENLVGMDHPFHLHGFSFQVLDRDGVPEPFPAWKDTVNVPRHSVVRFIVRYTEHPGQWMFHCHILDHEDHGMMGILEVR
jgi:FtsP/CotA-like multicopper oxidase with cupredoxin domain